ncbi:MAG: protein-L-isoaspartate(D-aspartate) O-methyltransferase [Archangium sp.]
MDIELPVHDPRVRAAFAEVSRADFLPDEQRDRAHEDRPLPIGFGQTASQPSLIAFMVDQLALTPSSRVLEVGSGSGYQTAVLAKLCDEVFALDVMAPLVERAQAALVAYDNVHMRVGNGAAGWPELAPFDAIVVCAATPEIPKALLEQLKPGGRMVIPFGPTEGAQLLRVEKRHDGSFKSVPLIGVRFVPLLD